MKKLTLSIGLLAGILTSNAQDTTCTMIQPNRVVECDYKTSKITSIVKHIGEVFLEIKDNEVLCLHLFDDKDRVRKITTYFPNGSEETSVLDSKNYEYFSKLGPMIVKIGKPKLFVLTNCVK